jgi:hypothetical protein
VTRPRRCGPAILALAALAAVASPAAAQDVQLLPAFRGLFEPVQAPPRSRHHLFLTGQTFLGRTGARAGTAETARQPLFDATFAGAAPILQYVYSGRRAVFQSISGGSFLQYGDIGFHATRYFQALRYATPVSPHSDVALRGSLSYSPFYVYELTVDPEQEETDLVPADQSLLIAFQKNLSADVVGQWRYRPRPRGTFTAEGGVSRIDYFGRGLSATGPMAGTRYVHQVTQNTRVQLGYRVRRWFYDTPGVQDVTIHQLNGGVAYSRPLQLSRPTRFGFDVGSGLAEGRGGTRFTVTGGGFFAHQLPAAWLAVASYRRGFDVQSAIAQPIFLFGDTTALTLRGRLLPRTVLATTGSYVRGTTLFDPIEQHVSWWTGTAVLSVRLAAALGAYVRGLYTSQQFSTQLGALVGLPTEIDRYSVTAGLTLVLPLLR